MKTKQIKAIEQKLSLLRHKQNKYLDQITDLEYKLLDVTEDIRDLRDSLIVLICPDPTLP